MKCKKMQDLIMSDYIDGELKGYLLKKVQDHLASCPECKQFEQSLQQEAIAPFKEAGQIKPPESVWEQIKGTILEEELQRKGVFSTIKNGLDYCLHAPKPVLACAAAVVLIVMTLIFTRLPFAGQGRYFGDDLEVFSYLEIDESSYVDFDTTIEEYFM